MPIDIIDSKIIYLLPLVKKKIPPKNICKTFFDNKSIEKINLSRIFHDPLVKAALPNTSAHLHTPTAVYTLTNAIGSKIFNFNKFVNDFDVKAFMGNSYNLP